MKRFLLSLLIVPLLLMGGFSSAGYEVVNNGSYTFCDGNCYSTFSYDVPLLSYKGQDICVYYEYERVSNIGGYYSINTSINPSRSYFSRNSSDNVCFTVGENDTYFNFSMGGFQNMYGYGKINYTISKYVPPLIPGEFSGLTPVITGISDVTTEFIPYVVYIGIGTLLVTLGFIAVKWLVNWLVRKITVIFKSKRG